VFGISYAGEGGPTALFGHFSQHYFNSSGAPPDNRFDAMIRNCEGQTNVCIEAVTNFMLRTPDSIKHVREALGEYGLPAKFYKA
jgi:hypothetical protein